MGRLDRAGAAGPPLEGGPDAWTEEILVTVAAVASREYTPKLFAANNTDFQFTRGLLGVSM